MYQLFKCKFVVFCIDGDKQMIAKMILQKYYTTEKISYMGEVNTMKEVYQIVNGDILEYIDHVTYLDFIKQNSLVKLMKMYWDTEIYNFELERKLELAQKPKFKKC